MRFSKFLIKSIQLALVISLYPSVLQCQIVGNHQAAVLKDVHYFNSHFIGANKIKTITGTVAVKKDLKPIVQTGTTITYDFDQNGKLKALSKTFINYFGQPDSNSLLRTYDDIQQLISETVVAKQGRETAHYEYNEQGKFSTISKSKSALTADAGTNNEVRSSFKQLSEQYMYMSVDSVTEIITVMNEYAEPYKTITLSYNALGKVVEESHRFKLTGNKQNTIYVYNDKGQLIESTTTGNSGIAQPSRHTFTYQEDGNLLEHRTFKSDRLIERQEFLYDPATGLLKAELTKNIAKEEIVIVQFTYDFY